MENQNKNPLHYYISDFKQNYEADFIRMGKMINAVSPEFSGIVFQISNFYFCVCELDFFI